MKLKEILVNALYTFVILASNGIGTQASEEVVYLQPDDVINVQQQQRRFGVYTSQLRIYCYRGSDKSLSRIFQTIQLLILDIEPDDFTQYEGETPEQVKEHYDTQTSIFSYFLTTKSTRIKLDPFNQTCIGIDAIQGYRIKLHVIRIDFWKLAYLAIGLSIFLNAGLLSHNPLFYYLSGIFLGIFASMLVLVYFTSKLVPRRPVMYGVIICGWSLAIYLIQMLWENIQVILITYKTYVLWYVIVTGFISFIVCYRIGPPENQRSRDLIKWGLQLLALVMIFYCSEFQEASAAMVIITLIVYYFPKSWIRRLKGIYLRRFPPKPKLLTSEEFYEQGVRETAKALEELRSYAGSPECQQWKIVTKLKDPLRFASFVEGTSHISDQEILEYETSRADFTDSDLSEEEDDDEDAKPMEQQPNIDEDISEDDENVESNIRLPYHKQNNIKNGQYTLKNQIVYSNYSQPSTSRSTRYNRSYYENNEFSD